MDDSQIGRIPDDANMKYDSDKDMWIRVEGDIAVIGITDYAQNQLESITYVDLPETDVDVSAGDSILTIEATKTNVDCTSPVSGKIISTNDSLLDSPQLVNDSPYGEGWMVKIKISNKEEISRLGSAKDYMQVLQAK